MKLAVSCALVAGAVLTFAAVAVATHERPGSATPTSVALVPAYSQCATPNTMHTPPLSSFGASCSPPTTRSSLLGIGSLGAGNGRAKFTVFCNDGTTPECLNPGDQEDVRLTLFLTDVRCQMDLGPALCAGDGDYLGQVILALPVRVTDHANGNPAADCANPSGNPPCVTATVQDFPLLTVTQCAPKPSPTLGSACSLQTTLDSLAPATVVERQRAVYEAGSIVVLDLGLDGALGPDCPPTCGTGDERPFMAQGWFTP